MSQAEDYWRTATSPLWIAKYQESATSAERIPLRTAIQLVAPFRTILDVGCHCGPMCSHVFAVQPNAQLLGIDINAEAIKVAKRDWPRQNWLHGSVMHWLPTFIVTGQSYDVLTACSLLSCIAPEEVNTVLGDMTALARQAIIIQDTTTTARMPEGATDGHGIPDHRYDYETRLRPFGWSLVHREWQHVETNRPAATLVFRKDPTL